MKNQILTTIVSCLLFASCVNQQIQGDFAAKVREFVNVTEPSYEGLARTACEIALSLAVDPKDLEDMKGDIFALSSVVAASNGQTPTEFVAAIRAVLPKTEEYNTLAGAIGGLYYIAYPYIKGDSQLLLKVVADLARGCAAATKSS